MFRRSKLQMLNQKDDPVKIITERINNTEKHLLSLCSAFSDNTRQVAKQRNTVDALSRSLKTYADEDGVNESFNQGLKNVAKVLTTMADHMDLNVRRVESKIVMEVISLDNQCKVSREEIRTAGIARDKEVLKQRQVMELKTKFSANSSATDSDLAKASQDVLRANKQLEELIINFEKRKLTAIKQIINDFIVISMKYHTKTLESLTQGYFELMDIDESGDLVDFQKLFKTEEEPSGGGGGLQKKKNRFKKFLKSKSMESLDHDEILSPLRSMNKLSKSTKSLSTVKSDDEGKPDKKNRNNDDDDDDDESWDSNNEDEEDLDEEEASEVSGDEEEETEDDEHSISSTEEDPPSTPKAPEETLASMPKEKIFGIRKPKPRSEIKHPFKAVAATHVRLQKQFHVQQQ